MVRTTPLGLLWRMVRHAGPLFSILLPFLAVGLAIYRYADNRSWPDSFLNAAMLIGGGRIFMVRRMPVVPAIVRLLSGMLVVARIRVVVPVASGIGRG